MTRLRYDRLRKERLSRGLDHDGYKSRGRKVGDTGVTEKQMEYINDLRKVCEDNGIRYTKRKVYHKEQASNEINGLRYLLKKHGYDTKGRKVNDKADFLEYMQNRK